MRRRVRSALTVARREWKGFVDQPTAYVLVVAFLGIALYLGFRSMYATGTASLRPLFDLLPVLFAVFIPAVTMRSLAEERRGRTLGWVLAQPLGETELVVGKFLGNWLFTLLALAGTVPTAVGVLLASEADPGIMVAQYVGAALLAGLLVSVGLWASSLTRNQITAFIVAAVVSFLLWLIGLPVVQIGLPPSVSGALARLSVESHFQNVARGVVDLRDVLYFVTATGFFLTLAGASVARLRLSPERAEARRLRLAVGLVGVIAVTVNLLGSRVEGRLDLTRDDLFTLSDGTREILSGVDDLVQVRLFASSELPPEIQLELRDVRDLLADMRRSADGSLDVEVLDPENDAEAEELASSFGIRPIEFNVLRDDEYQVRRGYYGLAVTYADQRHVIPVIRRTDDLELRLASAILSMTDTTRTELAFLTGFGARPPSRLSGVREVLGERYDITTRNLETDSALSLDPGATPVAVVAGPTRLLDSAAVEAVSSYVDAGGAALLLLDPLHVQARAPVPTAVTTGLEPLVEERGARPVSGVVADLASSERVSLGRQSIFSVVAPYPLWPVVRPVADHLLTRGLSALTLGWAGALEVTDSTRVTPLWSTSEAAGIRPASSSISPDQEWNLPEDELGVRVTAVAMEGAAGVDGSGSEGENADDGGAAAGSPGRMVVVRDVSFVEGQLSGANPQNLAFLANSVDWLAQDEALIGIRSKDRTPPSLAFSSELARGFLKWGNLIGVPLLFVLVGLVRITGRRRRAQLRWQEVVA